MCEARGMPVRRLTRAAAETLALCVCVRACVCACGQHASRMLPNLPRSARPRGALAVVTQSKQPITTSGPRGLRLDTRFAKKRTHYGPTPCSAPHLGTLLKGFLSTRMLCHSQSPGETVFFLRAENSELAHAASGQPSFDDSLSARAVGVTLLLYGNEVTCSASARAYLDALGHFAASRVDENDPHSPLVASSMRMTVLAGDDAEWFAKQVEKQTINSTADMGPGKVDVCVRWAVPGGNGVIRTELSSMRSETSLSAALEQVQNFLLSIKLVYNAPITDSITRSHTQIAPDTWAHTLHDATTAFFGKMEGESCIVKSPLLTKHEHEATVESTDMFLRIAPRRHWDHSSKQWMDLTAEMAALHPDAFHAFLIGNSAYSQEIVKFCQSNAATGLPPSDHDTGVYLLHTCAVQAAPLHLMHEVSLYGAHAATGRVPGTPISQPGSMIWRFDPAIVPLDDVLVNFYVLPCSRSSAMPADPKLERPFQQFFDKAFRLYTSFVSGRGAVDGLTRSPSLPLLVPEPGDAAVQTCEGYALNAFGLDLRAPNLTAGDAYAHLKKAGGPQQLQDFLLASCVNGGVNTNVLTALESGAAALQQLQGGLNKRDEDECRRLKRVADESLKVSSRSTRRKQRPISPPVELTSQQVKHLLSTVGLVKGEEAVIHYKDMLDRDGFTRVVDIMASCVAPRAVDDAKVHAVEAARSASKGGVLGAIALATCVLRSYKGATLAPVFVVAQTLGEEAGAQPAVRFTRVLPCGGLADSTAGVIIDTANAVVLLVRMGKSVRVTATVRG